MTDMILSVTVAISLFIILYSAFTVLLNPKVPNLHRSYDEILSDLGAPELKEPDTHTPTLPAPASSVRQYTKDEAVTWSHVNDYGYHTYTTKVGDFFLEVKDMSGHTANPNPVYWTVGDDKGTINSGFCKNVEDACMAAYECARRMALKKELKKASISKTSKSKKKKSKKKAFKLPVHANKEVHAKIMNKIKTLTPEEIVSFGQPNKIKPLKWKIPKGFTADKDSDIVEAHNGTYTLRVVLYASDEGPVWDIFKDGVFVMSSDNGYSSFAEAKKAATKALKELMQEGGK